MSYGLFSKEEKIKQTRLLRVSASRDDLEKLRRTLEHRRLFGVLTITTIERKER